jgi:transposase-like protein
MNLELETGCRCPNCKEGNILNVFCREYYQSTNRRVGGRGNATYFISSRYVCDNCGSSFEPTEKNSFEKNFSSRLSLVKKLFSNYSKHIVVENMSFFILKGKENLVPYEIKDKLFFTLNEEKSLSGFSSYEKKPFLVPRGKTNKLVSWSEYSSEKVQIGKIVKDGSSVFSYRDVENEPLPEGSFKLKQIFFIRGFNLSKDSVFVKI